MLELNPPKGLVVIVRTRALPNQERALARSGVFAAPVEVIVRRVKKYRAIDIYEESDMIIRTIRDIFTGDVDQSTSTSRWPTSAPKSSCRSLMPRYVNGCSL